MSKNTFGSFLASLRKSNSLTQKELGTRLGVSDKTISHWERDESLPDVSMIPVIAEFFGVSCDELLKGEKAESKEALLFSSDKENFEKFVLRKRFKQAIVACCGELFLFACLTLTVLFVNKLQWFSLLIALVGFAVSAIILNKIRKEIKTLYQPDKMTEKISLTTEFVCKTSVPFFIVLNSFLFFASFFIVVDKVSSASLPNIQTSFFVMRTGLIAALICFVSSFAVHYYNSLKPSERSSIISKAASSTVTMITILIFCVFALQTYSPYLLKNILTVSREPVTFSNMEDLVEYMETEKEPLPYTECEMDTVNVMTEYETKDGITYCRFYSYETEELVVSFKWLNSEARQIYFHNENGNYRAEVSFNEPTVTVDDFRESVNRFAPIFYSLAIIIPLIVCISKTRKKLKKEKVI